MVALKNPTPTEPGAIVECVNVCDLMINESLLSYKYREEFCRNGKCPVVKQEE